MSNISDRHSILKFNAGSSKALSGQRLIRVLYKPSKTNKEQKYPSVCVSVPAIKEPLPSDVIIKLNPYILEMVNKAQDGIVKSLYESAGGKLTSVGDEEISFDKICEYLENEMTGGRLTKEFLYSWFDENIRDNLLVVICEKMGVSDVDDPKALKSVNGYREMIASLSGGNVSFNEGQIKALIKALEIASIEDDTSKKLGTRLNKMLNPPKPDELFSLE